MFSHPMYRQAPGIAATSDAICPYSRKWHDPTPSLTSHPCLLSRFMRLWGLFGLVGLFGLYGCVQPHGLFGLYGCVQPHGLFGLYGCVQPDGLFGLFGFAQPHRLLGTTMLRLCRRPSRHAAAPPRSSNATNIVEAIAPTRTS